jgi:hypothetical protein
MLLSLEWLLPPKSASPFPSLNVAALFGRHNWTQACLLLREERKSRRPAKTSAALPRHVCRGACRQNRVRYPTADMIGPAVGADLDAMAASVIAAIDQRIAHARCAHFAERDFLLGGRHVLAARAPP